MKLILTIAILLVAFGVVSAQGRFLYQYAKNTWWWFIANFLAWEVGFSGIFLILNKKDLTGDFLTINIILIFIIGICAGIIQAVSFCFLPKK